MKYCQHCVLPDTRPNIRIQDDGICNACHNAKKKLAIDWDARQTAFKSVVENAKARSKGYDCLIPVSGGKDSTWQVLMCLEYGLNPLAVTWRPPMRTELGWDNLQNLIDLGVDHIDFTINPKTEKAFLRRALKEYGSTGIPMHMAMFNLPPKIASQMDIPLIVWGENSAFEYGSKEEEHEGFKLDATWFKHYGVTHGTTAEDWISDDLSRKALTPYFPPDESEFEAKQISAVFLGYYFPWDVETSLEAAQRNGFKVREEGPRLGIWNYADIDDHFMSLHHFMKWHKFGFTRAFDNLAFEIRSGRITRDEAIKKLYELGDQTPHEDIELFCDFVGMSRSEFDGIVDGFRNPDIWYQDQDGTWKIKDFLLNDWAW